MADPPQLSLTSCGAEGMVHFRTGLHHCPTPTLEGLWTLPLPSGQAGVSVSSPANFRLELSLPELIVSSPAHPPSASSEPQGGLGWFHGAAMHCPSPSWAERKEREMGMW